MKITILTAGSRGDVQPYVALGVKLKELGYQVTMPAPEVFKELIMKNGLDFIKTQSIDPQEFAKSLSMEEGTRSKNKLILMSKMFHELKPYMENSYNEALEACRGSDAIVSTLAYLGAFDIAEKLRIPCIFSMLFPVHSTTAFQAALAPEFFGVGVYNKLTHSLTEQLIWQPFRTIINHWRIYTLGLKPQVFCGPFKKIYSSTAPVLAGYSPLIVPKPQDWEDTIRVTGYWFLDEEEGWESDSELQAFLSSGPPPIYIGFGSMPVKEPEKITQVLLDALKISGQRGIISAGWGDLGNIKLPDNVIRVDSVPHNWLFKQVSAIVHHGGAGTTAAALRSGKPSIVIPFVFDQPFWGRCISELGVGGIIKYKELSAERLANLITICTNDEDLRSKARDLGQKIQVENGAANAAEAINDYLHNL